MCAGAGAGAGLDCSRAALLPSQLPAHTLRRPTALCTATHTRARRAHARAMAAAAGAVVRVLRLRGVPVLEQLRLEEALLRATSQNWLVLNDGTPGPTVVMGISG